MDDVLCGTDSVEELKILHSQLCERFNSADFPLHKWNSNSQVPLQSIDQSSQEKYIINPEGISNKVLRQS